MSTKVSTKERSVKPTIAHFTSRFVFVAAALVLSACAGDSGKNRADISPTDLQALRDQVAMLEGRADISPTDLQALRDQVAMLEGRADISPADLQALRTQIAMLEGRADISPTDLQALRDQVAMLESRVDISPTDLQALRTQIAMLEGRADISPTDLQALRDQIAALTGRADIAPGMPIPTGLVRSTGSIFAFDAEYGDLSAFSIAAPTLASGIRRDYDEQRSELASDAYIKSLGAQGIEDHGFTWVVTYVVGGEEVTVHFNDADRDTPGSGFSWTKTVDGVDYWGWIPGFGIGTAVNDRDYITFIGGISGYRLYAVAGLTETADLPSGTAVYEGGMRGDTHLTNDPSSGRQSMSGSLRLTADFDEGSLEGRISDIRIRPDNPRVWSDLPDTNYFAIDDGRIVDGQFTANLTGVDSNQNAPMDETVRGYEGGVLGQFHDWGEEVGGVLNASRDDRVMAGAFGGGEAAAVGRLPRVFRCACRGRDCVPDRGRGVCRPCSSDGPAAG